MAYGTGSNAPKAENVAIGKDAKISYSNGASDATGDIVVGSGAYINNYASQGGSIAVGKNAKIENMAGGGEASFAFGQTTYSGNWLSSARIPADPTKVVGSVAIGDNTFARTGSTMIGSHNYKGALGDITVDSASTRTYALNVYATTIGANSFSNGAFTTSTGVYNIISSKYNGGRLANPVQNLGATITGVLNSVESYKGDYYSGIANTVTGVANRTSNSNGSLIYGAGNEITNSVTSLSSVPTDGGSSAKDFADKLRAAIRTSNSGGATLAIGGGNKADYTQASQMIGVNNTLTGTSAAVSKYNMINGYKNTAGNVSNVSVIGSENTVENTKTAILMGDKRKLTAANNSVILGSADQTMTTDKAKVVVLGANANSIVEGGVALGADSVASTDKGVAGYDPATKAASTDASATWKSTAAAVSVGAAGITRQITNVAAGTEDTDAVNVAQLKKLQETVNNTVGEAAKHSTVVAGDYVQVVEGTNAAGGKEYTISGPQLTSADGTVKITDKVENGKKVGYNLSVDTSAISGEVNKGMNFAGDTGAAVNKKLGETLAIKGGATELTEGNIGVEAKDGALTVKLAKNVKGVETLEVKEKITVGETVIGKDSVTTKEIKAGDTTVNNDGMKINNGPTITKDNVDMNNQQIHNVKEGTASSDAATVGQVRNITDRLGGRVDKVGAGAAALAALHPVDFDADDKLDIAAGWGNYRGENALALGAFYRPDERTLFSIGGTFGNGENMVNAGFTFKLDRRAENGGIRPITSKAALVKKVETLTADNAAMKNKIDTMESEMKELKEFIAKMAGSANK